MPPTCYIFWTVHSKWIPKMTDLGFQKPSKILPKSNKKTTKRRHKKGSTTNAEIRRKYHLQISKNQCNIDRNTKSHIHISKRFVHEKRPQKNSIPFQFEVDWRRRSRRGRYRLRSRSSTTITTKTTITTRKITTTRRTSWRGKIPVSVWKIFDDYWGNQQLGGPKRVPRCMGIIF